MKIACISWGSLIWNSGILDCHNHWFEDGPILPIEFARQSKNGRMTLVLEPGSSPVRTLWTLMKSLDLNEAINSLGTREGIPIKSVSKRIRGLKVTDNGKNEIEKEVIGWLKEKRLDAAIYTNLPPKFNGTDNVVPDENQLISYLSSLDLSTRDLAKEYFEKTPKQIDTKFRKLIERNFGWKNNNITN